MRTKGELLAEFGRALEFPDYFGQNWDALQECLTDLSWLPGDIYVVLIERANWLLEGGIADELRKFANSMNHAGAAWASPVERGESWDRPAKPFHVLLHDDLDVEQSLRGRLEDVRVDVATVDID